MYEELFETLVQYHKILQQETLKAASDILLKKINFPGQILEDKNIKLLTSRKECFQKLQPPLI